MKVFVNWDPLYENVICVHTTEDGECEKCKAVAERAAKDHCYHVAGDWFEIIEDNCGVEQSGSSSGS